MRKDETATQSSGAAVQVMATSRIGFRRTPEKVQSIVQPLVFSDAERNGVSSCGSVDPPRGWPCLWPVPLDPWTQIPWRQLSDLAPNIHHHRRRASRPHPQFFRPPTLVQPVYNNQFANMTRATQTISIGMLLTSVCSPLPLYIQNWMLTRERSTFLYSSKSSRCPRRSKRRLCRS